MTGARRTAALASLVMGLGACGLSFELPAQPSAEPPAPAVDKVMPDVAVGALGSPVLIQGRNLLGATSVKIGPMTFGPGEFEVATRKVKAGDSVDEVLLHVTRARLLAAKIADADGERYTVRVSVGDDSADALDGVRVYARLPQITDLSPNDLAAGRLFAIKGLGFDADDFDKNDVAFPPNAGTPCWEGANRTGACRHAPTFWAARGIVMATVPKDLAAGPARIAYRNQQFEKLAEAARAWVADGRPLGDFFSDIDPATGISATAAQNASVEDVCAWATTSLIDGALSELAVVWEDPGAITADRRVVDSVTIRGAGRLCYPLVGQAQRLGVLVDGVPLARASIRCVPGDERALKLTLPASVLALTSSVHALQVQNPLFQSPVAFFIPN